MIRPKEELLQLKVGNYSNLLYRDRILCFFGYLFQHLLFFKKNCRQNFKVGSLEKHWLLLKLSVFLSASRISRCLQTYAKRYDCRFFIKEVFPGVKLPDTWPTDFKFRAVLVLDCLPTKLTELSLSCYLTHGLWEKGVNSLFSQSCDSERNEIGRNLNFARRFDFWRR